MMVSCVFDDHKAGQGAVRQKEEGPLWSVSSAIKSLVHVLRLLHCHMSLDKNHNSTY